MSNIENDDRKKLNEYKSKMLETYKDLVVYYEESREIYEEIIEELIKDKISPNTEVVACSTIIAYNDSYTLTKWALNDINGNRIYTTEDNYKINKTLYLTLADVGIEEGTQCTLKAVIKAGTDSSSDVIIVHDPNSPYAAKFKLTGVIDKTTLTFIGIIDRW